MNGEHSHWERYHARVKAKEDIEGYVVHRYEVLQLICLDDGIIFHEVEIKEK